MIDPRRKLPKTGAAEPGSAKWRCRTNIDWWKSVQVRNASDKVLLMLETQDEDRGPKCGSLDVRNLAGARIRFHQAKVFGVHTGMYQLPPDLTSLAHARSSVVQSTEVGAFGGSDSRVS